MAGASVLRVARFFVVSLLWGSLAFSQSVTLEAYGDSLTAGFLADTSLINPPPLEKLSKMLEELAFAFIQKDRSAMKKFESNENAWPHYLSESLKREGIDVAEVANLAVSGSKSAEIIHQVKQRGKSSAPSWAFFFVGHNDLCHVMGDEAAVADQFRNHLNESLAEWEKNHEGSTAYLIPAGPIYKLYPVLDNYEWFQSEQKTFKCQDAWTKYFPYCVHFYQRYKRGDLESYLKPRTEAVNAVVIDLVKEWDKKSAGRNRYKYIADPWPMPLEPKLFAMDCYHQADPGQRIFADNVLSSILR